MHIYMFSAVTTLRKMCGRMEVVIDIAADNSDNDYK